QGNLHQIRNTASGIKHRDKSIVRLAGTDRARMRKRNREFGISDQNGPGGLSLHLHDTGGKPFEVSNQIKVHYVQTFLKRFDQKLTLAALPRLEPSDVIRRANLAIRTRQDYRLSWLDNFIRAKARESQWI